MKKNSEKIILGAASVIALGFSYLGYAKIGAVAEDFAFASNPSKKDDASIVGAADLDKTIAAIDLPILSPTKLVGEKKRPVDLSIGVPLYAKKPSGSEAAKPIDPILAEPIHPPIVNTWWIENNLKRDMMLSDGPLRDADGDGFSNLDEFNGKTNPNDRSSFPELADKLEFTQYKSTPYFLWFTMALGERQYEFKIAELDGAAFENLAPDAQEKHLRGEGPKGELPFARTGEPVAPDDIIFDKTLDRKWDAAVQTFKKDRFQLKKVETRKVFNKKTNTEESVEFASILDKKANKGDTFEMERNPRERHKSVRYDRSAVLSLNAAGEAGKTFTIEENTAFALPSDSKEKKYSLKEVSKDKIIIEYKLSNGEAKTREISLKQ